MTPERINEIEWYLERLGFVSKAEVTELCRLARLGLHHKQPKAERDETMATNKYHRTIRDLDHGGEITVDVYSVLEAFSVTCPARQHAIKKLLCAGIRGKGDELQDLTETAQAVQRAIELQKQRSRPHP